MEQLHLLYVKQLRTKPASLHKHWPKPRLELERQSTLSAYEIEPDHLERSRENAQVRLSLPELSVRIVAPNRGWYKSQARLLLDVVRR